MSSPQSPGTPSSPPSPGHDRFQQATGAKVASEALKRKRQRDKESQRRKRLRERQYTTTLEKRIAQLENQLAATTGLPEHPTGQPTTPQCCSIGFDYYDSRGQIRISPEEAVFPSASLAQVSPGLTLVDEISASAATPSQVLPSTSPQVLFTPQSLDVETPPSSDNVPPGRSNSSPEAQITANTTPSTQGQDISVPLSLFESVLRTPEWMRIPNLNFSQISSARPWIRGDRLGPFVRRIRSDPEAEALCPPQPKTIDILFGGSKNVLANLIAGEVAKEALLPPEKFAISWMLYLYVKWLIWPSEETFYVIPERLRPTALQLAVPHPWCIDLVPWPEVRNKLIRDRDKYDIDEVIGLFLCTYRIRGSFNSNFITREDGGELQVDANFYRRFMDPEGWGILERFWIEYEDLVADLNPNFMIREVHLLPS